LPHSESRTTSIPWRKFGRISHQPNRVTQGLTAGIPSYRKTSSSDLSTTRVGRECCGP
jgi:hypothetical protein